MINCRGYSIDKEEPRVQQLSKKLVVRPVTYDMNKKRGFKNDSEKFSVYRESSKRFYMPRAFAIEALGKPSIDTFPERMLPIKDEHIHFNGTLREHQINSIEMINKEYETNGSCILCLPCGYGKTCVAINMIHRMKVKTLVVVHKEFLMTQWKERIEEFLPHARIGYIQQNKCEIEDKDVVIGMLQSISSREYEKGTFECFGQLITDECHHIAARAFSNAMFKMQCKYMLGLSATPDRADGLTVILKWFFGHILVPITRPKNYTVQVDIIRNPHLFECAINSKKESMAGLITTISDDLERNYMLLKKLQDVIKDTPERQVIILSDRREHLVYLQKQIEKMEFACKKTCGLYIGGMNKHKLKESEGCNIILSTFSMTSEGFDIPTLNTLFLSTPKSNIEQSVGRILRRSSDIPPLVVDIYDNHGLLEGMYRKRIRFYKKNGYAIDYGDNKGRVSQVSKTEAPKNTKIDTYAFRDDD